MQAKGLLLLCTVLCSFQLAAPSLISFRAEQVRFPRVRTAAEEKDEVLRRLFTQKDLSYPPRVILLRAFRKRSNLGTMDGGVARKALLARKDIPALRNVGKNRSEEKIWG
jgi:hypothetical protein